MARSGGYVVLATYPSSSSNTVHEVRRGGREPARRLEIGGLRSHGTEGGAVLDPDGHARLPGRESF